MTPPDKIHYSSINVGERLRKTYNGIEELADAVFDEGLIQPLVLVPLDQTGNYGDDNPVFGLDAGGRRHRALGLLLEDGRWDGWLHHGATSLYDPVRPGYVLKGADQATPLKRLITEIGENMQREDPDWRDVVPAITRAWRLAKADKNAKGEDIIMRDFGHLLGVGYANLQAAVYIHDDLIAHPDRYKDCTTIRNAYALLLRQSAIEATKLVAAKSLSEPVVKVQSEPRPLTKSGAMEIANKVIAELENVPTISLSSAFFNVDAFDFMKGQPDATFDHIVTDPDYGLSRETLAANSDNMSAGVHQGDVDQSLGDYQQLIEQSARLVKPQGFLVFWYDLDHHEKLQTMAMSYGFAVQRWPLIWIKEDYRSNAAPSYNFAKNMEYAMVCRKPNAILTRAQLSSVYRYPGQPTVKEFHHPFAKPLELTKWILGAISVKGQTIYDPFLGSGAIACAAAEYGLRPVGTEISVDHYPNALMNLQRYYKKLIGREVNFR